MTTPAAVKVVASPPLPGPSTPPAPPTDSVIVTSKGNVIQKITFDTGPSTSASSISAAAVATAQTAAVVKTTMTGKQLRQKQTPVPRTGSAVPAVAETTPTAAVMTPVVGRGRGSVARGGVGGSVSGTPTAAAATAAMTPSSDAEGIGRGAASALRSAGLGQRGGKAARGKARGAKK